MSHDRKAAPPQLMFDDGSRVMTTAATEDSVAAVSPRGSVPIEEYYEVERLSKEILEVLKNRHVTNDGFLCRVALQFPDELLQDSPEVCWAMESALCSASNEEKTPLVFVLGDTTFGSCCPDEISALHLQADVLVHYGHACLSPVMSLPVLYGFGITDMDVNACVDCVVDKARQEGVQRLLLLYEVRYHHAMETLQTQLSESGDLLVLAGEIPQSCDTEECVNDNAVRDKGIACCRNEAGHEASAECQCDCKQTSDSSILEKDSHQQYAEVQPNVMLPSDKTDNIAEPNTFIVGGLRVPWNVDLSLYTLLFIGDPSQEGSSSSSRQYVNTMLRFLSSPTGPANHWTYSPALQELKTSLPTNLQRQLNRRFYLVQKARDASVFGILVGTLSQRHFRSVVSALRETIETADRACYTFAVGKINGAKLANFGEIDCFVLVACGENSLLDNERDLHVPVITPLELDMALGNVEWGSAAYSLDYNDFLYMQNRSASLGGSGLDEEEQDAPYFSLVTGKYEPSKKVTGGSSDLDLAALPGKGQIMAYESVAAEYLKKREYKGLEANVGQNQVQAAVQGQAGIASDYGQR